MAAVNTVGIREGKGRENESAYLRRDDSIQCNIRS